MLQIDDQMFVGYMLLEEREEIYGTELQEHFTNTCCEMNNTSKFDQLSQIAQCVGHDLSLLTMNLNSVVGIRLSGGHYEQILPQDTFVCIRN